MTPSDKKKAEVLVLLLLIAGGTWYYVGFSEPAPVAPAAAAAKSQAKPKGSKANPEAQIRLDLLEGHTGAGEVGRKNIFQYRQKPLPPKPPEPVRVVSTPAPLPTPPIVERPPAPPPFKAFRYEGYSSRSGKLIASLSEGGNSYQVTEGECLMGQYCVRRLTDMTIEIEDLQLKRRQSFTRVQQ